MCPLGPGLRRRRQSLRNSQLTLRYVRFLMRFIGAQMFLVMKMCDGVVGGRDLHPFKVTWGAILLSVTYLLIPPAPPLMVGLLTWQHQRLTSLLHPRTLTNTHTRGRWSESTFYKRTKIPKYKRNAYKRKQIQIYTKQVFEFHVYWKNIKS